MVSSIATDDGTNPWPALWQSHFAALQWCPSETQQAQLRQLYPAILAGNRQVNLTRITEPDDFWEKHIWDSLTGLSPWFSAVSPWTLPHHIIDVGTGGGFPGLVAAIAFPESSVTLLDSTRKKITCLTQIIEDLGLKNVKAIAERVETHGQSAPHREHYDLALIRAVGSPSVCAEYTLPLLKSGGMAVLYRGQWEDTEKQPIQAVAKTLGGSLNTVKAWITPLSQSQRHCVYLRKDGKTPKAYPRAIGVPTQKPL